MGAKIGDGSTNPVYDVLIVGAGIVGSAAAVAFARQGRRVLLLERSLKEPDRIVGELLQPGGVAALERLGLRSCLDGIDAIPVRGYDILYRGESIIFFYPPLGSGGRDSEAVIALENTKTSNGRPEGRSFHHGQFVVKLRDAAKSEENVEMVETTAVELHVEEVTGRVLGVKCITAERLEQNYFAHLTILVDGQASNFRSQCHNRRPIAKSRFWGLELIDAKLPNYGRACGVIGSGPPVLIYQIGTHETRILIDIPEYVYEATSTTGGVKNYIRKNVVPTLPTSVQPMMKTALKQGRLRSMPNSWLPSKFNNTAGMLLLGDAMNMRHPLIGGGMTVGLNDVALVSQLLSPQVVPSLEDGEVVLQQIKIFHSKRKAYSMSLNVLAQALYSLFVADGPQLRVLQRGFIHYIRRGGACVEEAAGLMGGVVNSPWLLVSQFASVAVWSLRLLIFERFTASIWLLPMALFECVLVVLKACEVILPFIFLEVWA